MLKQRVAAALAAAVPANARLVVAFSGGLDSTVLLHVLREICAPENLRAIHVNHGLQPEAADWAEHCCTLCAQWDVPCTCLTVTVDQGGGAGPEAQARAARYAALAEELTPDEWLVTAHHQQDQLETVLLALLRGAGVHGLAAMPVLREHKGLQLVRPMLELSRAELAAAAEAAGLSWLEDPSNLDEAFDRNYLRHRIVPLLEQRWPAAARSAVRSARLAAEAMEMLDDLAAADCGDALQGCCLELTCLRRLAPPRRRNLLRWVCRRLMLPVPSETQLGEALQSLLSERADAEPLAAWPGARVRRYRDWLWFYPEAEDPGSDQWSDGATELCWDPDGALEMGPVRGTLRLIDAGQYVAGDWRVRFRTGGEQLRPGPQARRRDLKKLLQEDGVLPWMRRHIPLIYLDGQLLAVADLWWNADHPAAVDSGAKSVRWSEHPPLHAPG